MLPDQADRWVTQVMGRGSRVVRVRRLGLGGWHVNDALDVVDAGGRTHRLVLRRLADELGASSSQVVIAWTRLRSRNLHPILGARRVDQLTDNLGAWISS